MILFRDAIYRPVTIIFDGKAELEDFTNLLCKVTALREFEPAHRLLAHTMWGMLIRLEEEECTFTQITRSNP